MPCANGVCHASHACPWHTLTPPVKFARILSSQGGGATEQGWHRCRRRRDRVGVASRETPYSLSITIDLGRELLGLLSPVHSYETSLPSLTKPLIINCISVRLNAMALFSAARSTRAPTPQVDCRTSRGGVAQLGCLVVVVVSWFVLLGRCVVRRGTGRRLFFVFQS